MSWAVKVPFDGIYMYLTEGDSIFQLRVRTFETREEAEKYASLWGDDCLVEEHKAQGEGVMDELCNRCNYYPATKKSHICPYSSEINQDETKCTCCKYCEEQCAMDI